MKHIIKSKSDAIFMHKLLKAIADSIIKLFIPLYILKTTGSIALSLGYLSLYSLFVVLFLFAFKKFIEKYGVIAIIIHFIPIIITMALFSFCELNFWIILVSALLMAMTQTLYSVPLNLLFALQDKKVNVAKFQIASNVGKLVMTLISGFFMSSSVKNSFLILSILSSLFYILCVIPILSSYKVMKDEYDKLNFEGNKKLSTNKWFTIFHMSFGCFQATMDNVVPLYLYVNNLSFKAVTILIAVIELLKILVNYFAKFLVKHGKQKISCLICAVMFSISLIGIIFIKNSVLLYVLSCVCSVSFPLTFVPMFKLFCEQVNQEGCTIYQTTKRDIDIFSFRPVFYSTYYLNLGFYGCFTIAIASLIVMTISEMKLIK